LVDVDGDEEDEGGIMQADGTTTVGLGAAAAAVDMSSVARVVETDQFPSLSSRAKEDSEVPRRGKLMLRCGSFTSWSVA
jgi:hypothetical protein